MNYHQQSELKKCFLDKTKIEKVEIILTNACNLKCTYCFANGGSYNKPKRKISKDILNSIIKFIRENNVKEVVFFGGEPSLAEEEIKYFCDLLNLYNLKPRLKMVSNLYFISDALIDLIKDNNIILTGSLDGPEDINNINRKAYDNGNVYQRVTKNIFSLKEAGIHISAIEATITKEHRNLGYDKKFIEKYLQDTFGVSTIYIEDDINESDYLDLIESHYVGKSNSVILNDKVRLKRMVANYFGKYQRTCGLCDAGRRNICIDVDGEIYPCHFYILEGEKYKLGNIVDQNLKRFELVDKARKKMNCSCCEARWSCSACTYLFITKKIPYDSFCKARKQINSELLYQIIENH
ncbi:radical SAM/SPASM domain-containing protein [uncultured Dubosiella sp.]|uniref:radical SAM/SPASM domain-containing protein n=1 Tax=uncultured Dubosiella sp. TaxID=1937011 RepID=UPI00273204BB|nr:radical SAM protein [uncultured Dubosiella sp.]